MLHEWRCFQKRNRLLGIFWLLCHQTFKPDFLLFENWSTNQHKLLPGYPSSSGPSFSAVTRLSSKQLKTALLHPIAHVAGHTKLDTSHAAVNKLWWVSFQNQDRSNLVKFSHNASKRRETLDVCEELSKI